MGSEAELRAGATYLLDDFSVIQVVEVGVGQVGYRIRSRVWRRWRRRIEVRHAAPGRLLRRIRAEINGDFFPDVALPTAYRFEHPDIQAAALRTHLATRAAQWPFQRRP